MLVNKSGYSVPVIDGLVMCVYVYVYSPEVVLGGDGGVLVVGVEKHHGGRQRAARVERLRLQPRAAGTAECWRNYSV